MCVFVGLGFFSQIVQFLSFPSTSNYLSIITFRIAPFTYFMLFLPPFLFPFCTVKTKITIHASRIWDEIGNKLQKGEKSCVLSKYVILFCISSCFPSVTWLVEWPVVTQTSLFFLVFCMHCILYVNFFFLKHMWKRYIVMLSATLVQGEYLFLRSLSNVAGTRNPFWVTKKFADKILQ